MPSWNPRNFCVFIHQSQIIPSFPPVIVGNLIPKLHKWEIDKGRHGYDDNLNDCPSPASKTIKPKCSWCTPRQSHTWVNGCIKPTARCRQSKLLELYQNEGQEHDRFITIGKPKTTGSLTLKIAGKSSQSLILLDLAKSMATTTWKWSRFFRDKIENYPKIAVMNMSALIDRQLICASRALLASKFDIKAVTTPLTTDWPWRQPPQKEMKKAIPIAPLQRFVRPCRGTWMTSNHLNKGTATSRYLMII